MNTGQVDVLHIVRAIIVFDLAARPVYTFDLDDLAVLDSATKWDCSTSGPTEPKKVSGLTIRMPSVLDGVSARCQGP